MLCENTSESHHADAVARGHEIDITLPKVHSAHYEPAIDKVVVKLSTGRSLAFNARNAQQLQDAVPENLRTIEISSNGLGLHFPEIDADLYLPSLL